MKILFLCTANSCRSILSEALFNAMAPMDMKAYSAGSQPKGVALRLKRRWFDNASNPVRQE